MDLALKKIELIDWLKNQDQNIVDQIDKIRKSELKRKYANRMTKDVHSKLDRSNLNITQGNTKSQDEVEALFKNR